MNDQIYKQKIDYQKLTELVNKKLNTAFPSKKVYYLHKMFCKNRYIVDAIESIIKEANKSE